ncbi:threonine/homoserine/homoserine lactone efflux protein [Murinocardiopsis flavida]|uniref:Threonine/homoserine/homoserine lactone efflux protein n=1 Tax=Murinocardiopsis flavida TaxID=645275 RepID=A0A2P8CZ31_9ACTN|nr:LysE family transporter [Murinocardiopsis flavida]PSK90238.1 threonine/homoserine/homoserine lactone efflux protein [Murinocardiopsis flavida]
MPENLPVFFLTTIVVLVVPGPDFVVVTRTTVARGRAAGLAAAAGIATGLAGYTALAAAGVTVLIAANPAALSVLRFAGALYLIALGAGALITLWRGRHDGTPDDPAAAHRAPDAPAGPRPARSTAGLRAAFAQGLLNNSLNPKALVFFLGFLPQFIAPGSPAAPQTLFLGACVVTLAVAWWAGYVAAITRITAVLRRRRARRGIDLAGGLALTTFGLALAAG